MRKLLALLSAFALAAACTSEDYEAGDGNYSYLRADFVDAYTAEVSTLQSAMSDDGDTLVFAKPLPCSWAVKTDTVYRALLYYDCREAEPRPIAATNVLRLPLKSVADLKDGVMKTDPVEWESAWVSRNSRYLNLGLNVKTGQLESLGGAVVPQSLGLVCDTVTEAADGRHTAHLTLYHAQNGAPQYYTAKVYVSIPLEQLAHADTVALSVNTYGGSLVRRFVNR